MRLPPPLSCHMRGNGDRKEQTKISNPYWSRGCDGCRAKRREPTSRNLFFNLHSHLIPSSSTRTRSLIEICNILRPPSYMKHGHLPISLRHPLHSKQCTRPSTLPPLPCPPSRTWPSSPSANTTGLTQQTPPISFPFNPHPPGVPTLLTLPTPYPTLSNPLLSHNFLRCLSPRSRAR